MPHARLFPRYARSRLVEALADTPVVLVHGPRQCGKTTLVLAVGRAAGCAYFIFDDDNLLAAAKADPAGCVVDPPTKAVLDEMQRVPELFREERHWRVKGAKPCRWIVAVAHSKINIIYE